MISVFLKEVNSFFSSLIGYIAIVVYLLAMGLFVWIFPDTNVLDYGFASLESLFVTAPWVLMFLIPAITMRSFAEEKSTGTIELLATKPLSDLSIILGKFFAALSLVVFSLLPTVVYYYSIYNLGATPGNIDGGAFWGSYIGLFLLGGSFTAIGLFSSSVTNNQIVAFILSVFFCFFFFTAFDYLSRLDAFYASLDSLIQNIGIMAHYDSISRGVLDTRDLVYFISLMTGFLFLSKVSFESRKW